MNERYIEAFPTVDPSKRSKTRKTYDRETGQLVRTLTCWPIDPKVQAGVDGIFQAARQERQNKPLKKFIRKIIEALNLDV